MLNDDQGLGELEAQREASEKQFKAAGKQVRILTSAARQLAELGKFSDTITPEDVVEAAGRIVASGAPAAAVAGLMAEMPTVPGEALQGWVGQMAQRAEQALAKAQMGQEAARHSLATNSLRAIIGHTVAGHRADFVQKYESANPGATAPGGALGGAAPTPAPNAPSSPTLQ